MKKWGLIYTFLITLPILDLITSISNRITDSFFSVGMIIKGLAILISIIYVIFISSSQKRKITLWYFGFILVYLLFYFGFKPDLLYTNNLLRESDNILRFIYFPTMLFTFLNIFDEKDFPKELMNNILFISLIIYVIFIVMFIIFKINISSYINVSYFESVGWYYSANAIFTILLLLFPFMLLLNELKIFKRNKINNRKISILALHLGYGGIENAIANIANMLSDDYEVEIISLYKKDIIPFKISKKVSIKYLTNICSNREEFKKALKEMKIISVINEGIKAIYILVNKKRWIKKAIIYNDAKVVIATRIEFSEILNDYGKKEIIKIHQEHTYRVDLEYISLLNQLDNIDYIMPVSIPLMKAYQEKVNSKLKYIPLCLSNYPKEKEKSKLNNNNLIAIGRLEKEKCFSDLINVISKVETEDVYLNIFGNGSEMECLKLQAKELDVQTKVKFWGYKSPDFISNYLQKSSLYVMTSLEESFGLVLIEAMSYGIPCVTFDSAKGATSIIDDSCGYIVKDRNIAEMARIIDNYLKLPLKDKNELGKKARANAKKYEFKNIKKEWLKFIDEVIK